MREGSKILWWEKNVNQLAMASRSPFYGPAKTSFKCSAEMSVPGSIAVDSAGNLYLTDVLHSRIRKVSGGVITTIAGNGTMGFSGDNGLATDAQLSFSMSIAVDSAGNVYVTDPIGHRVRIVRPSTPPLRGPR